MTRKWLYPPPAPGYAEAFLRSVGWVRLKYIGQVKTKIGPAQLFDVSDDTPRLRHHGEVFVGRVRGDELTTIVREKPSDLEQLARAKQLDLFKKNPAFDWHLEEVRKSLGGRKLYFYRSLIKPEWVLTITVPGVQTHQPIPAKRRAHAYLYKEEGYIGNDELRGMGKMIDRTTWFIKGPPTLAKVKYPGIKWAESIMYSDLEKLSQAKARKNGGRWGHRMMGYFYFADQAQGIVGNPKKGKKSKKKKKKMKMPKRRDVTAEMMIERWGGTGGSGAHGKESRKTERRKRKQRDISESYDNPRRRTVAVPQYPNIRRTRGGQIILEDKEGPRSWRSPGGDIPDSPTELPPIELAEEALSDAGYHSPEYVGVGNAYAWFASHGQEVPNIPALVFNTHLTDLQGVELLVYWKGPLSRSTTGGGAAYRWILTIREQDKPSELEQLSRLRKNPQRAAATRRERSHFCDKCDEKVPRGALIEREVWGRSGHTESTWLCQTCYYPYTPTAGAYRMSPKLKRAMKRKRTKTRSR